MEVPNHTIEEERQNQFNKDLDAYRLADQTRPISRY